MFFETTNGMIINSAYIKRIDRHHTANHKGCQVIDSDDRSWELSRATDVDKLADPDTIIPGSGRVLLVDWHPACDVENPTVADLKIEELDIIAWRINGDFPTAITLRGEVNCHRICAFIALPDGKFQIADDPDQVFNSKSEVFERLLGWARNTHTIK
jgi:hypothetical protein